MSYDNFSSFYTPVFKTGRIMVYCPSVCPFHMSHLITAWPIHFKFHRVIGIDMTENRIYYPMSYDNLSSVSQNVLKFY